MLFRIYKRTRTPRVVQMEAVECGAASLSILLRYYGKYLPLEELRISCGVSRDGSNAFNILKAAKSYGLEGEGFKKNLAELQEIPLPAILFWEFNHFLVLEGFSRTKVYLNDPGLGRYTLSYAEFNKKYAGIVLCFEKTDQFCKEGQSESVLKQLYIQVKRIPTPISFLFLSGVFLLLPGFALPAFLRAFIDTFFAQNIIVWKEKFLGFVFITFLFSALLTGMRKYYLTRLGAHLSWVFSTQFLWHLLQLPIQFYNQRYPGEIAYRQKLNDSVAEMMTNTLLGTLIDLLLIFFYAILLFFYDPTIAWVSLIAALCNFASLSLIYKSRINTYARLQQNLGKSIREGISGLQQIETIKAKGAESDFFAKWAGAYTNVFNDQQETGKKDVLLNIIPPFFQLLAAAVLLGLGSLYILDGSISIGTLMAMQLLQTQFLQPISRFIGLNELMQNMKVDLDRIHDVLNNRIDPAYEPPLQTSVTRSFPTRLKGKLEFRNVTFGYSPLSEPLIENLSFIIEPGQRLAIVGPTGSGKSTVAKLAARLLRPWSGQILLDDLPLEEIPKELLYQSLATVDQQIFLFSGTIRDNITMWNSTLSDELLIHATQDAHIHDEIIARPHNYDSHLTEGGRNLSGGQKQRLEIARALLYNPPLLILDEAMSALDSTLEKQISDRISIRNHSTLMIAHRLSTIQDCDEILVLERGKLVQRGSHEVLRAIPGIYQELVYSESLI